MAGNGQGISAELISLEIASPDVPDLTLIDLPGIARVAVKGQPENIGDQVGIPILSTAVMGGNFFGRNLFHRKVYVRSNLESVFLTPTQHLMNYFIDHSTSKTVGPNSK